MKEFYILTTATFLEIIFATLIILELQGKTKELKELTQKIDKMSKEQLSNLQSFKIKLKEFNTSFDEKLSINAKNLGILSKLIKEVIAETTVNKLLFKRTNVLFAALNKVWKHKKEFFWLLMAVFLMNKKTAENH